MFPEIDRLQYGINWRALLVTIVTVAPLLPGIAHATNHTPISLGGQHLYTFNWLYCFFVSLTSYFVLSKVWPAKETIVPETVPGIVDDSIGVEDGVQEEKLNKAISGSVQETKEAQV